MNSVNLQKDILTDSLSNNFFKNLIDLENKYEMCPLFKDLKEILIQYKYAIEYYSDKSIERKKAYLLKMQYLISNKEAQKLIIQDYLIKPDRVSTRHDSLESVKLLI